MLAGKVHGILNAFSNNSWIDQELFDLWFDNLVLKYAQAIAFAYGWGIPHTIAPRQPGKLLDTK